MIKIITVEGDEGMAQDPRTFTEGEVAFLSLPCPGRNIRGGAGGAMMTACMFCGEVMASTAGPHSREGRWYKPVLVYASNATGFISWESYNPVLAALIEQKEERDA